MERGGWDDDDDTMRTGIRRGGGGRGVGGLSEGGEGRFDTP